MRCCNMHAYGESVTCRKSTGFIARSRTWMRSVGLYLTCIGSLSIPEGKVSNHAYPHVPPEYSTAQMRCPSALMPSEPQMSELSTRRNEQTRICSCPKHSTWQLGPKPYISCMTAVTMEASLQRMIVLQSQAAERQHESLGDLIEREVGNVVCA